MKITDVEPVAGMIPWACSYTGPNGRPHAITLYGTDSKQVVRDNRDDLPELRVEGRLHAIVTFEDGECGE